MIKILAKLYESATSHSILTLYKSAVSLAMTILFPSFNGWMDGWMDDTEFYIDSFTGTMIG